MSKEPYFSLSLSLSLSLTLSPKTMSFMASSSGLISVFQEISSSAANGFPPRSSQIEFCHGTGIKQTNLNRPTQKKTQRAESSNKVRVTGGNGDSQASPARLTEGCIIGLRILGNVIRIIRLCKPPPRRAPWQTCITTKPYYVVPLFSQMRPKLFSFSQGYILPIDFPHTPERNMIGRKQFLVMRGNALQYAANQMKCSWTSVQINKIRSFNSRMKKKPRTS